MFYFIKDSERQNKSLMPKSMPMLMAIFPNGPGKLQWAIYVQKFRYKKLILNISLRILWSFYFEKYSHLILLKLESRARRWRTTLRFQTFLMAAHLFLLIHEILYAHILYVLHKKLLRIAQKMLWQKKKIRHRSYVAHQNCVSHKKICCDNNKNYVTHKREIHVD